jgi:hypothetical protein
MLANAQRRGVQLMTGLLKLAERYELAAPVLPLSVCMVTASIPV